MKKSIRILVVLLIALVIMPVTNVRADEDLKANLGYICKDGRYIFFSAAGFCSTEPFMRLDTKTGKIKKIVSSMYKGNTTDGFQDISVKGKYIYCTWDICHNNWTDTNYIYRISLKGKKKRLACGDNPVIKGKRIYYDQMKIVKEDGDKWTEYTGKKYSMKLDGTDKREEKDTISLKRRVGSKGISVVKGKYKYYIGKNERTLYRKNIKNGKKIKLITFSRYVYSFSVSRNYIGVCGSMKEDPSNVHMYILKTNGKSKRDVATWELGVG